MVCHPHIVMEIACGTPPNRRAIIGMMSELESTPVATSNELLAMLEAQRLNGRGCGLVDLSLIASAMLANKTLLWTLHKRLDQIAGELNIAYRPTLPS